MVLTKKILYLKISLHAINFSGSSLSGYSNDKSSHQDIDDLLSGTLRDLYIFLKANSHLCCKCYCCQGPYLNSLYITVSQDKEVKCFSIDLGKL